MALDHGCAVKLLHSLLYEKSSGNLLSLGTVLLARGIQPQLFDASGYTDMHSDLAASIAQDAVRFNGPTASFLRELADAIEMKETSNGA